MRDSSISRRNRQSSRPRAALVLGAGWSRPAGLPLAGQLFDPPPRELLGWTNFPVREVPEAFRQWNLAHPNSTAEQFIGHVYKSPFMFELPGEYFPYHPIYDAQLQLPEPPGPGLCHAVECRRLDRRGLLPACIRHRGSAPLLRRQPRPTHSHLRPLGRASCVGVRRVCPTASFELHAGLAEDRDDRRPGRGTPFAHRHQRARGDPWGGKDSNLRPTDYESGRKPSIEANLA